MFRARDVIRGNQGVVTSIRNGNVKEMAYVRSFEMSADIADIERPMLGKSVIQHKKGLINLSGSLSLDSVTSDFIDMLTEYKETGIFPDLTLVGVLNDPESAAGTRRVKFTGVSFNSLPLFLLDIGTDEITDDIDVVANDFEFLDKPTL